MLKSRKETLLAALPRAAEVVQRWRIDPALSARNKENSADPVTQGDLASQEVIIEEIKKSHPDDLVISEEVPGSHKMIEDRSWSGWVLDPIDGTNNFSRGISYYSVSIAWIEGGEPQLGGIINPCNNEVFLAEKDGGATCNGSPIGVTRQTDFGPATRVATSNIIGGTWKNLARLQNLGDVWFDIQGSTVLQLAELAAGRVDFFCHSGLKPWDSAAAFLVVREAGGQILDLQGSEASWRLPEAVAGNPDLVRRFFQKQT